MGVSYLEAVKGEKGYWHATEGDWFDGGSLRTLCGRGVGPHYRRFNMRSVKGVVDCPKCLERMDNMKYQQFKCKGCGSDNLTPLNKRVARRQSICEFHCEGCGRVTKTVAYYVPNDQYIRKPKDI